MKSRQKMDWYRLGQRFSIRTYHVGAVSVLLGSLLLASPVVQAEENVSLDSQPLETVVEEVAKAEESVLVPASTEASETPAEALSTDTAVAGDLEKVSLEIQEAAKETAVDTAATEEKPVATPETIAVEASPQEDKPALTVKEPTKVPVGNVNALTENEKAEVRVNVLAVNETATDVVVADNGQVTLYFGEETAVLDASKVVKQREGVSKRKLRAADPGLQISYADIRVDKSNYLNHFSVNGDATYNGVDGVVTLTPDINNKTGFTYLKDRISLNNDFSIELSKKLLVSS